MRIGGFTLLEILLAVFLLSLAVLSVFWTIDQSNRGALDAQYEFLAQSLLREPIEVFRGLGFRRLSEYESRPLADYPLGWSSLGNPIPGGGIQRPVEAADFRRHIELKRVDREGHQAIRVTVRVHPVDESRVMSWLSRKEISLEGLILEKLP